MKNKHIRNTVAGRWAIDNGCSVHKAIIYRNRLKRYFIPGILREEHEINNSPNPMDRYLITFRFAMYKWDTAPSGFRRLQLALTDDRHCCYTENEAIEYANTYILPKIQLNDYWAKVYNVPANALQLLHINKQRMK